MISIKLIFILLFLNFNQNILTNGQTQTEYDALVNLFSKTGVLNYYPYDQISNQYDFCNQGSNNTAVTSVICTGNKVVKIVLECGKQNEILATDFIGKFPNLYFSTPGFYMTFIKCTVERGFLSNFPQKTNERIYYIKLDRCENSLSLLGKAPIWSINIVFDKAISITIDLGLLRGDLELSNFNNAKLPHTIYYINTGTTYTNQIVTLKIFASHYPPIGPFLNIGFLTLNLLDNYDRSTISNVLDYGSVGSVEIKEDFTSTSLSLIPPIDQMFNKTRTQILRVNGFFYTDRLLDYSSFTVLYGIIITIDNYLMNFTAPGNKFALSGLPKNLSSGRGYFELTGFGGLFSTTSDYAVFKNTDKSDFSIVGSKNGILGPLPSWDKTITSIKSLDFSYNRLNGTLDDSFCSIQKFVVDYNSLTGEIPSCMKCYMQKTPGSITIKGNRFTNNNNNQTCTSIIPSYLVVNGSGSYLFGKDLGFNGSYVTSTPVANWVVNTPSSVLYTSTKFQANTLVRLTFSIIDKVLTVPVNISAPVFQSIEAKTNEKISFSGSYFTYNASDIQITLYDKKGQSYSCPVIQGDSTFSSISCNITNFSQLKDESNVKAIIRIGIYTNQLSINFGIINSPISMCSDNQCNERSYCLTNNATCTCNYGYTGLPDCTTPHYDCLNDCSSSSGGGTCNYSTGVCNCNQYRDGTDCSSILCKNSCFNGGTCDKTIGECKCSSNYQGKDCSIPFIKCSSNCLNGGSCNNVTGECKCSGNYQGKDCSIPFIKCSSNCLNGGSCNNVTGECKCSGNYQGKDCSIPFIECSSNCLNGGSCNNVTGECKCSSNYQGKDCSIPFIKCSSNCLNGGTCDSTIGQCKCTQDYQGNDCSITFIKCLSDCLNGGTCNNVTGQCKCKGGYQGNDCSITFIKCLSDCLNGGTCNNVTGQCKCNEGYQGLDCSIPFIECSNNCLNGGTCDNAIGECKCSGNYQGKDCSIPFIKCSSNCLNGGSCNNVTGECVCLSGYEGPVCSLKKCSNDCLNGGTCDSTIGQCKCTQDYQGNDCSMPFLECSSNCLNGGTCNTLTGQCKCKGGYQGSDCSKPFIECSSSCLNGGDCNNATGQCKCGEGYQGSDCSIPFIECSSNCLNGGTCDNAIGKCICSNEYQGDDCSSKKCTSNSCLNGGTCNLSTYNCQCINGYQGDDCSILHCSNNCLNGGSCDLSIGECKCNEDYQGPDCSIPFIECKNVCGRNGDCNNQTGHCIYECPTQCYNQGKCDQETGICKCPTIEFIGIDCSIPNHWVSSINETSNTGGEVTLYGWFGDLHNNLSVLIGQLNCDNPVAIDSKTIKCQLPSGQSGIKNVNITQNEIIWIGKDLYHYIDNDSNIKENNCLNNCNNRGICLSSGECRCNDGWKGLDCNSLGSSDSTNTDVDNNGKTTINDNFNNYEIFIDKLIELDFNGQQVKVYDLNKKWEKVINDTNNNSIQSFNQKLDNNQGELVYKVEIIDQTKDYSFSDLTYRLEKGSIKISMFINNYTYSNTLNTLQLQMITTTENIENKGNECNQKDTEIESNSNQLLNFVTIKKDNKVLYGRFINKVISDGRSTHLKTSVISSDQIKSTVTMGMDLPHCRNCIIDPDFSLLLTSNFKDSCGDNDKRKSYVIPVAVVASVAGVAAIGASGFLIHRKKKVEVSQARLRKILKNNQTN
ncbi:hypothetical protein ACTA71_003765 [Dictyostelium dimigraforme]